MTKPATVAEGDQNAEPKPFELPSQVRIVLDSDDIASLIERERIDRGEDWTPANEQELVALARNAIMKRILS